MLIERKCKWSCWGEHDEGGLMGLRRPKDEAEQRILIFRCRVSRLFFNTTEQDWMSSFHHLVVSWEVVLICQRPVLWLDGFSGIMAQCSWQMLPMLILRCISKHGDIPRHPTPRAAAVHSLLMVSLISEAITLVVVACGCIHRGI